MAEDEQFKAELLRQRNIYRQLNQEAHAAIDACGGSAQGQSAMAKLNTKVSIGMKTITDKSTRNLAEMLTQGSGMGEQRSCCHSAQPLHAGCPCSSGWCQCGRCYWCSTALTASAQALSSRMMLITATRVCICNRPF